MSIRGFLFSLEKPWAPGRALGVVLHGLWEGQCGQQVATPLTLLMQSVLVSVVLGVLQPHPPNLGFSL